MFAIAFDLVVKDAQTHYPKGVTQAYDDMAKLFSAIMALKAQPWFPKSVKDIRAFKVEQWSNFTAIIKAP